MVHNLNEKLIKGWKPRAYITSSKAAKGDLQQLSDNIKNITVQKKGRIHVSLFAYTVIVIDKLF